ncbi:MAG: histidine--tRNA ligase, partial [Clostridiales bacterium]|nr:histidine--tRNA ligase [Clostridiales bacterium]
MKENNKNSIFQNPKGTHDILPDEIYKWHYVESIAKEVSLAFHAREIRTPIFEHTELFLRGVGDGTDIVSKEMYTFLDKGGRSLTLKPEGTAAIARSYVQHNLESLGLPLRLYYITPVFRYENPQKGRFRQHHQFGIECFGSSSALMDFEVILLAYVFLNKLGISNFSLYINSIGCSACRSIYVQALKSFIQANSCAFCSTCMERLNTNPLRILDCKVKSCKEALVNSPLIIDFLCIDCKQHQEHLTNQLAYANIEYSINPHIVRGLDYYNRTVFEFVTNSQILANQSTICGGGRYDNLIDT